MYIPPENIPQNSKFLEGVGESAWFYIEPAENKNEFIVSRYTTEGKLDCQNIFKLQSSGFNILESYEITYVSHCAKCTIIQQGKKFVLIKK